LQQSDIDRELSVPTLRQLDYLVAIAETRHFSRAARRVHTTQSTLSLQIKALEERLGVLLVDRSARSVTLTDTGHEVVDIARRILRDAQLIHELARAKRADCLQA
jgi:LysR family hydrogen peroxide-inducible transcriptional activator